jgi:hypothetical protein
MMNDKMQAILLKLILNLKKLKWEAGQDWEITLKSEGHVPLIKMIQVEGSMDNEEWNDHVEIAMDLKLDSQDEITYFPDYTIFGQIFIDGGSTEDIAYNMDADVAFTNEDYRDDRKLQSAAEKINQLVDNHVQSQYTKYIDDNMENIQYYKTGGQGKADHRPDDLR